jgi:hypothetical protein
VARRELELRHWLRARAGGGSRATRSTDQRKLPLRHTAHNRVWLEIVQIALDLLAGAPMLALTGQARLWEPGGLRLRLYIPRQLVPTGQRRIIHLFGMSRKGCVTTALERLAQLPDPG